MLVGRTAEQERIAQLLGGAREGRSGVLLLRGDAGVGKTALLDDARAHADGLTVLRARGRDAESELAFSALADLLAPLLPELDGLPPAQRAALEGALALAPPSPGDPFRAGAAALSLLAAVAERAPVLAVIDDLQWLDTASAQALLFVARRIEAEGIAFLLATRNDEPSAFDSARMPELPVSGLDGPAAAALLPDVAPSVLEELMAATGGNPLALIEISALLSDGQRAGRELLEQPLPAGASAEQAFRQRLEQLPVETRTALLVAAADDEGSFSAIAGALGSLGIAASAIDAAEAAGLIVLAPGALEFRHPLVRSAVYHGATPQERRAAHGALAEAMAETDGVRRTWHRAAAALMPDEELAAALEQAAADAHLRGGFGAAARALDRAARLTPDQHERARRLIAAAEAAQLAGRSARAMELIDEALTLTTDPLERADGHVVRGRIRMWQAPAEAAITLAAEAERIATLDPERATRILIDVTNVRQMIGDVAAAIATSRRACEIAAAAGGPIEAIASAQLGHTLVLAGRSPEGTALLSRSEAVLVAPGQPLETSGLVPMFAMVWTWFERFDDAEQVLLDLTERARAAGAPGVLPLALAVLAEGQYRTGRWTAAAANASEAAELAEATEQHAEVGHALVWLAYVEAAQGRGDECRAHVARIVELAAFGSAALLNYGGAVLGSLALAEGAYEEAISHLESVAARAAETGLREPATIPWAPDLVEAYLRAGRADDARATLATFEADATQAGRSWPLAAAARGRGLLASDDEFAAHFDEALRLHAETPTPFERARTELAFGERLRRVRQWGRAREYLRAALFTFDRLGAVPWAGRARAELGRSGRQVEMGARPALVDLTPQELQVARVVAEGATNKEAGATLFLSAKTVDYHLGHIYRKLGIRSRADLSRVMAESADAG